MQPIVCMGGGARQGAVWGWDGASSQLPTSRAQRARPQPPWPAGGGGVRRGVLGPGGPAARTTRRQGGLVGGLGVVAANGFESRPNTYLNGPNSQLKAAPD